MYHATERLPHLLRAEAYFSDEHFDWEMRHVFPQSWHFVGLRSDLLEPGDFVTAEICGWPIQVRNIAGSIHAVSNVCAHRHCLLTSKKKGNSDKLRCQYHGWEYDSSGATRRIPLAQHFAPLEHACAKIPVYRVEILGPLVFVNLDSSAPNLKSAFGESLDAIQSGFGDDWEVVMSREFLHSVNWKIPVENSLEAYHVPAIHPDTFRTDPGEDRSTHVLGDNGTSFKTTLPFAPHSKIDAWFQQIEGRVLRALTRKSPTSVYQHHHVFPNMLFSFTDMVSILHVVVPTGPQTCSSIIHQFGRSGKSFVSRKVARVWGQFASSLTLKILAEDFRLYPDIQRGLISSQNSGMLGRCEERIHRFQQWIEWQPTANRLEMEASNHHQSASKPCYGCETADHSHRPTESSTKP